VAAAKVGGNVTGPVCDDTSQGNVKSACTRKEEEDSSVAGSHAAHIHKNTPTITKERSIGQNPMPTFPLQKFIRLRTRVIIIIIMFCLALARLFSRAVGCNAGVPTVCRSLMSPSSR
jgi:hypothetical protein